MKEEDNNNIHILRRDSEGSVNSEGWMEVGSQETEPTITSFTHSYRLVAKWFEYRGHLVQINNIIS